MEPVSFWASFLKMLFALAVVLGLLIGAMHFFKKVLQQTPAGMNDHAAINVVAARYLGPKSSIMIVEVLGKYIIIGIANNQMTSLGTIADEDALVKLKYSAVQERKLPPLAEYLVGHRIVTTLRNRLEKIVRRT